MLEKMFKFKENNTNVKTEVIAGLTTFMTMAYILAVNPNLLSAAGMDPTAVLIATCLASFIGTLAMALMANYPFALAPGMGLNAYFAFTVCGNMGYDWRVALMAVFIEGIIFIVLSLTNVREAIFNAIPATLKKGVSAGIGLFIAFIGLQGAHIVVDNSSTFVICTFSLFAIVPQLALFMVLLQLISMEFVLYNNKFFRTVDERFRLFSQKISRETGDVSGQASLVQSANKVEKESGRIYAKLMKSSALKRLKYCNRRIGEKSFYLVLEAVGAVAICYVAIADIIKTGDIGRLALISGAAVQMKIRCETLLRSYLSIDEYKNKIADIRKRMQLPKVLERVTGNNRLSAADNFIRLENVSFAYPALKRLEDVGFLTEVKYGNTVLENVTLDVRAGGVTVVAGTSGIGSDIFNKSPDCDYG